MRWAAFRKFDLIGNKVSLFFFHFLHENWLSILYLVKKIMFCGVHVFAKIPFQNKKKNRFTFTKIFDVQKTVINSKTQLVIYKFKLNKLTKHMYNLTLNV